MAGGGETTIVRPASTSTAPWIKPCATRRSASPRPSASARAVGDLPRAAIAAALAHGQREAARLRAAGLSDGAVLILKGETVVVHDNREAA